jgi:hypothetical protein
MNTIPSPNPHDIRLYDIRSIDLLEDVDGTWWLEAATLCGHTVSVVMFAKSNTFAVNVSKDGRTVREYSGPRGSHAEQVFNGFHKEYFGF